MAYASKKSVNKSGNVNLGKVDIFVNSHIPFRPVVTNPVYKIITSSHDKFPPTKLDIVRSYEWENPYYAENNILWNEYSALAKIAFDEKMRLKKYTGINHYRRFFYWMDNIPDIDVLFDSGFDIVLGTPVSYSDVMQRFGHIQDADTYNTKKFYGFFHNVKDLDKLGDIIKDLYPEMAESVDHVWNNTNYCYNSLMSIWRTDDLLEYADFAFDVLDTLCDEYNCHTNDEWIKHVNDNWDEYAKPEAPYYDRPEIQARVVGYLAERACNVYLHHKREGGSSFVDKAANIDWGMVDEKDYKVN